MLLIQKEYPVMTKFLLSLLFVSSSVFADVTNLNVVKALDGKTFYCDSKGDVGKTGYRLVNTTVTPSDQALQLSTTVDSFVCVQNSDGSFGVQTRSLLEPIKGVDLAGNAITFVGSDFRYLLVNMSYSPLAEVDPANKGTGDTIDMVIPFQGAFTQGQLALLAQNVVHMRWAFFLQANYNVERGDETMQLGRSTSGSFYINFDVTRENGVVKVHNLTIQ
jgi:hypothetical protein